MEYFDIEKSIIKKYRKTIFTKFVKAIKEYDLIKTNDKIAVCISGGKDSFLLAKLMQELKKHQKYDYELEYIVMDPGYCKKNIKQIEDNAKKLNIKINIFKTDIFKILDNQNQSFPCYLCARMRRGHLYSKAKELGCNKIALGHHFDDVIETLLLNMFYNGTFKGMPPILKSDNFQNMELIRPLYFVKEESIKSWSKYNNLEFLDCACSVTKKKMASKRLEIKKLIKDLKKTNENIDINLLRSLENVNIDTINGFIVNGKKQSKYNNVN